jgi:uncharacterized protein (TIGR03084 family)
LSSNEVLQGLLADLGAERGELTSLLKRLPPESWHAPTPAIGWDVQDQVAHLARFDEVTLMCIASPDDFSLLRERMGDLQTYVDAVGPRFAHLSPEQMIGWWTGAGEALVQAAALADPAVRVPWFGPSMSLASKITARIMETWAHGQDVHDAIGSTRSATLRLKHVARIGVLAFPNSFRTRGLPTPDVSVLVDLEAPDGTRWAWGDPDSDDVVRGTALDFCLVVTQRRHLADVDLHAEGPVATRWMEIAQAFAGPAGGGRRPGEFAAGWVPLAAGR